MNSGTHKFKCKQCGWCCKNKVISVAYSDIVRWFNQGRKDILKEISFINNYPRKNTGAFYIAKTTFNPKQACPFFENGLCSIYETRPRCCRDFPNKPEPKCIGCKTAKFDMDYREKVRKKQYLDYKRAHNNIRQLINILVEARNS